MRGWYDGLRISVFIDQLWAVEEQFQALISVALACAVDRYETLIGGAYEAAKSVDDAYGELAACVEICFKKWIRARQAAGVVAHETIDALLAWITPTRFVNRGTRITVLQAPARG
jgi:hypothetical protein